MIVSKMVIRIVFLVALAGFSAVTLAGCNFAKSSKSGRMWTLPVVFNAENNDLLDQVEFYDLLQKPQIKFVLLDFWSSWDKPEANEVEAISNLYNNNKDKGLMVLGVSLDKTEMPKERVLDYIGNVTYPILWDQEMILKEKYSITSFPSHILIDKNNQVVFKNEGISQEVLSALTNKISGLLP